MESSIFQNPERLHLTIGTLVLVNNAEIQKATQLLHDCQKELVGLVQILTD